MRYLILCFCLFACSLETEPGGYIPDDSDGGVDLAVTEQALLPVGCSGNIITTNVVRCSAFDNIYDGVGRVGYCANPYNLPGPSVAVNFVGGRGWSTGGIYISNNSQLCYRTAHISGFQSCYNAQTGAPATPIYVQDLKVPGYWWAPADGEVFTLPRCGSGLVNGGATIEIQMNGYSQYRR